VRDGTAATHIPGPILVLCTVCSGPDSESRRRPRRINLSEGHWPTECPGPEAAEPALTALEGGPSAPLAGDESAAGAVRNLGGPPESPWPAARSPRGGSERAGAWQSWAELAPSGGGRVVATECLATAFTMHWQPRSVPVMAGVAVAAPEPLTA
jgi:hypothetical protein